MVDVNTEYGRLRAARKAAGHRSARSAAEAIGISVATYGQHENGIRGFAHEAARYAEFFGVTADWLLRGVGSPPAGMSRIPQPSGRTSRNEAALPTHLSAPLLEVLQASFSAPCILTGRTIGRLWRPAAFSSAPNAYAVKVFGHLMEPRFRPGETVWLDPDAPYRSGDEVLITLNPDAERKQRCHLAQFTSHARGAVHARFYDGEPTKDSVSFSHDLVSSIHKVIGVFAT